jgi:hypothetical protein
LGEFGIAVAERLAELVNMAVGFALQDTAEAARMAGMLDRVAGFAEACMAFASVGTLVDFAELGILSTIGKKGTDLVCMHWKWGTEKRMDCQNYCMPDSVTVGNLFGIPLEGASGWFLCCDRSSKFCQNLRLSSLPTQVATQVWLQSHRSLHFEEEPTGLVLLGEVEGVFGD